MKQPLLNIKNLSYSIENKPILSDISLHVSAGEFVCLTGPSGCGKSTLASIIAGLIKPTAGTVEIDSTRKNCVTLVSQENTLFPWKTIRQNMLLGMYGQPRTPDEKMKKAETVLLEFGLGDHIDLYPGQLSGGLKQRAHIARSLLYGAEIVILDEPFSALDDQTRRHMQQALLAIWEKLGLTIIFITHYLAESIIVSDTIYVMKPHPGEIVERIHVDLPRPRRREDRTKKAFRDIEDRLFTKLKEFV